MATTNLDVINGLNAALEEYFRSGDAAAVVAWFEPGCPISTPGMPTSIEDLQQLWPAFRTAFSDASIALGESVSSGDMIAYRITFNVTHTGDFMGIPATGKRISLSETHVDRIRNGKIASHTGDIDMLGLMQQVGAIPAPA